MKRHTQIALLVTLVLGVACGQTSKHYYFNSETLPATTTDNGDAITTTPQTEVPNIPIGVVAAPPQAISFDLLAAGLANTCGITDDARVQCWGRSNSNASADVNRPPGLSGVTSVGVGDDYACAVDMHGLTCWGAPGHQVPAELRWVEKLEVGAKHACAIDVKEGLHCWGDNFYGQSDVPAHLKSALDVAVGDTSTCVLDKDFKWGCFGSDNTSATRLGFALETADPANQPDSVYLASNFACTVMNGVLACAANLIDADFNPPALTDVVEVQTFHNLACANDREAGVVCFGNGGTLAVPELLNSKESKVTASSITVGMSHACAVTNQGTMCFGYDGDGQTKIPQFEQAQ